MIFQRGGLVLTMQEAEAKGCPQTLRAFNASGGGKATLSLILIDRSY